MTSDATRPAAAVRKRCSAISPFSATRDSRRLHGALGQIASAGSQEFFYGLEVRTRALHEGEMATVPNDLKRTVGQ